MMTFSVRRLARKIIVSKLYKLEMFKGGLFNTYIKEIGSNFKYSSEKNGCSEELNIDNQVIKDFFDNFFSCDFNLKSAVQSLPKDIFDDANRLSEEIILEKEKIENEILSINDLISNAQFKILSILILSLNYFNKESVRKSLKNVDLAFLNKFYEVFLVGIDIAYLNQLLCIDNYISEAEIFNLEHFLSSKVSFGIFSSDISAEELSMDKLIFNLVNTLILESPVAYDIMIENCIYWDYMFDMVVCIFSNFLKGAKIASGSSKGLNNFRPFLYCLGKEDIEFSLSLFRETLISKKKIDELITKNLDARWRLDRLFKLDHIIISTAITEVLTFLNIPKPVTINEFVMIMKFFVGLDAAKILNGLVDSIQKI